MRLKLNFLLSTLFVTFLGTMSANDCYQVFDCLDSGCSRFCNECSPGVLSPAQPLNGCGFFVGGDFLYWTTYQSNLDYASDSAGGDVLDGKTHVADYDWDAGYRVFGGYLFGCDGWDGRVIYTSWSSEASGSASANNDHLKPTLISPDWGEEEADEAKLKLCLDYRVLDVLFSRPFCISPTLNMRPYFGFRALWLDQDLKATYSGGSDFSNNNVVKWDNDYFGAGLHAGVECRACLCKGLALNVDFAGSIVAGEAEDHQKQIRLSGSGPSVLDTRIDLKKDECIAIPGYHLGANLSWETCCDRAYFIFSVGYEMNHWFQTPQISRYVDETLEAVNTSGSSGSLLLHGLTVRANVHF